MLTMSSGPSLRKAISGGQIGADLAGLIAGREAGLETGGTAPLGYRIHGGVNLELKDFGLDEDSSFNYKPRTIKNVMDSDATIIIAKNLHSPGCLLTSRTCLQKKKKVLQIKVPQFEEPDYDKCITQVENFLISNQIEVVNIAGNRDHEQCGPSLYDSVLKILVPAFRKAKYEQTE